MQEKEPHLLRILALARLTRGSPIGRDRPASEKEIMKRNPAPAVILIILGFGETRRAAPWLTRDRLPVFGDRERLDYSRYRADFIIPHEHRGDPSPRPSRARSMRARVCALTHRGPLKTV